MPELPEVETTVRALRPLLIGRRIERAQIRWPKHLDRPDLAAFQRRITGCTIQGLSRRAKFILIHLSDNEELIIHLRMTGHLSVDHAASEVNKHVHSRFLLDNGEELRFRDTRKFGRVYLVRDPDEVLGDLGPEPLDASFSKKSLRKIVDGRRRILKPFLLDQRIIAGIGNIYADEALFYARLLPSRRTDTLSKADIDALYNGIQKALRLGIEREGASVDSYAKPDGKRGDMQNALSVFRRTGQPCLRCDGTIERIVLSGRSTHYCPGCQV